MVVALALALFQPSEEKVRILVPAYFRPAGEGLRHWDRLIASAAKAPITVIVNPASGPGKRVDARYAEVLGRAKGLTLIGYVSTSYGKRTLEEVKADVDRWIEFYPQVRGLFLDEQSSGADRVDHYAALYAYARTEKKLDLVVSNPGINCDEGYVARPAADAVCLFEHHTGFDARRPAPWTSKYGPERFCILPYATPTADEMRRRVASSIQSRFGWIYVTDASGENPWNRLPSYWDELLDAVQGKKDR